MPAKIMYSHYDGDRGLNNTMEYIAYVIEEPIEVLLELYKTHVVHKLFDQLAPIDDKFPNKFEGLVITEVPYCDMLEDVLGIDVQITGSIYDIDIEKGKLDDPRSNEYVLCFLSKEIESAQEERDYRIEKQLPAHNSLNKISRLTYIRDCIGRKGKHDHVK